MKATVRISNVKDNGDRGDLVHLADVQYSSPGGFRVDKAFEIEDLKKLAGADGKVHLAFQVV